MPNPLTLSVLADKNGALPADRATHEPSPDGLGHTVSVPSAKRTLKESLARFMDPQAFEPVPARIKFTSSAVGKSTHDKRKVRREIALKRADAAIRFFMKPENAQAIEARRAATLGAVHESAVPQECAQEQASSSPKIGEE